MTTVILRRETRREGLLEIDDNGTVVLPIRAASAYHKVVVIISPGGSKSAILCLGILRIQSHRDHPRQRVCVFSRMVYVSIPNAQNSGELGGSVSGYRLKMIDWGSVDI